MLGSMQYIYFSNLRIDRNLILLNNKVINFVKIFLCIE